MFQPPGRKFEIKHSTVQDTNVVQGDGNQTVQGTGNRAVIGDHNVYAENLLLHQTPAEKRPRLERQLLTQVEIEVNDRLRQSLHNQIFIKLDKQQAPTQVSRPWDTEVKIGNRAPEPIPHGQTIADVFARPDIAGKLLILGHPGSGKTTIMLELANTLIKNAGQDIEQPVPVLFTLSSWQDNNQTIAEWLIKELRAKYGVREAIGKELLAEQKLLPLLDGLDELAPQRQEPCVKSINAWLGSELRAHQVVICSRLREYETYETVLSLNGAIYLQPLKPAQIKAYLNQTQEPELWSVVSLDDTLLELVKLPLWLSVLTLAYKELALKHWQRLETTQERLTMLLDTYIVSRLHGEIASDYYQTGKIPTAKQTGQWLVWLAQHMEQDEFLIEQMQPTLLNNHREKWQMRLIVGLIRGIIGGVILGLLKGPFWGVLGGLVGGLIVGLIWGLTPIDTVEILDVNASPIGRKLFVRNLLWGLILGLLWGLIRSFIIGPLGGLILGLALGLIMGITWGLIDSCKADIQTQVQSNQGILNSGRNTLLLLAIAVPVASCLWLGLPMGLALIPNLGHENIAIIKQGSVAALLMSVWCLGGGESYLRHYALRFVLARSGKTPYLYANFLNYCTERLLVQRVGGRFRFLHKTLKEHFAAMPLEAYGRSVR